MKIVVHPPTVEGPEGTEDVAAVVVAAIRQGTRLVGSDLDTPTIAGPIGDDPYPEEPNED